MSIARIHSVLHTTVRLGEKKIVCKGGIQSVERNVLNSKFSYGVLTLADY